jgi:NADPH-dependent ferric siderophore reductase
MNASQEFRLSGIAIPKDASEMLGEICEHFVEHADVHRTENKATLTSKLGSAEIGIEDRQLSIELRCPSQQALQLSQTSLAEHLFYFAGDDPFELTWSQTARLARLPNIHEVTVVSCEDVTPHMRRVKFACADVGPFIGGEMHVRLLVPPKGRLPIWPGQREDGRVAWPEGDDTLLVRAYTIRAVDAERGELWIDFLQHPSPGVATPGADFARDTQPGDKVALLGPGGGALPLATNLLLIGDESALPAIARIVAEVPEGTQIQAIIEVENQEEEQPLPSRASLDVLWLHRQAYFSDHSKRLRDEAHAAIAAMPSNTFVWVACEKEDIRSIKASLKTLQHDKKKMYAAWYWTRKPGGSTDG